MISLVHKVVEYFVGDVNSNSPRFELDRPRLEDFIPVTHSETETQSFEGVVTSVYGLYIIIDNDIYCDASKFPVGEKFCVNDQVRGIAQRTTKHEGWEVVKLQSLIAEWDTDSKEKLDKFKSHKASDTKDDAYIGNYVNSALHSEVILQRDISSGTQGIPKRDLVSSLMKNSQIEHSSELVRSDEDLKDILQEQQTVLGRVTSIFADTVTINEDVSFSLFATRYDWEIVKGDWIICNIASASPVQVDGNTELKGFIKVSSFKPLRRKRLRGEVTLYYPSHCIINQDIYCTRNVAEAASVKEGDTVTVEVIESHQGKFCWRAVVVTLGVMSPTTQELRISADVNNLLDFPIFQVPLGGRKIKDILENKQNIVISQSLKFPLVTLGSQVYTSAFIKNTGQKAKSLNRVYFVSTSKECQFSLVCCSSGGLTDGTPVNIEPNMVVNIQFKCTGKLLGLVKQLCIFDFGNFQIGRYVSATTEDHHMACLAPETPYTPHLRLRKPILYHPENRKIVLGEKPLRSPAFLPVSIPVAPIPQQLWQALDGGADVLHMFPFLAEPLNPENHKKKLTLLLHLEEIEMVQQMRQFDMMTASFVPHGEYLSLTVPGLAEKRPSLMIGDTVIASSPSGLCDVEFEGYIHEVHNTQILLKFHPTFHVEYCGEDYAVRFNFNRTPLRRCHFALDFSMKQLGPDVLFPSKMKIQLPQVCYIDPEVPTPTTRVKKAQDSISLVKCDHVSGSQYARTRRILEMPIGRPKTMNRPLKGRGWFNESTARNFLKMKIDDQENNLDINKMLEDVNEKLIHDLKEMHTDVSRADVKDNISGKSCLTEEFQNFMEDKLTGQDGEENRIYEKRCMKDNTLNIIEDQFQGQDQMFTKEINSVHFATEKKIRDKEVSSSCHKIQAQIYKEDFTPSRVPVVTRLFGVPSSGSSSNSSLCCSNDDFRTRTSPEDHVLHLIKAGKINRIPDECEVISERKTAMSVTQASTKVGSRNSKLSICAPSSDTLLETNVNNGKYFSTSVDAVSKKQQHKMEGHKMNLKSKLQMATNRPSELYRASGAVKVLSGAEVSQFESSGRKTLFIPRSQELNFYRNMKKKREVKDQKHSGALAREELGRTEKRKISNIDCSMGIGPSDVMSFKKYDQAPSANHFDEEELFEFSESSQSKQIPQNLTKPRNVSHTDQKSSAVLEKLYIVPVLPLHHTRKKGMEKLSHLPILKWFNKELNFEQKLAVRRILEGTTRPLPYVIFGPPGTGKTVTLVETALQILTMMQHSRLLIVTPSNSASDLVMERLLASNQLGKMDLVRLNAYQRLEEAVPEIIRPYCCNGDQLSVRVHQRIIVTTATTAGLLYTLGLHNGHFSHVLVDEAGQLTEPECLLALGLLNSSSGQIVLAGDPAQLGPVVQSTLARRYGLQQSFLQRLCCSVIYQPQEMDKSSAWMYEPCLVTQLVRNYRSHPDIFAVSSNLFYHNSLQACADNKRIEKLLAWDQLPCSSCPLLFHGVVSNNLQEGDSPSWFNAAEAFQVVRYTKSLIMYGVKPQDVGIITPYRKQVEKVRKLLTAFGIQEGIKVGSVEEFQGQEKCVIIISTVRSSSDMLEVDVHHSLGFVKCPKRFNVAVTRAQALLVVVGNPVLLSLDNCWREFIKFCIQNRTYRGPELHDLINGNED